MNPLKWFHLEWYPSCLSYVLSWSLLYAFYYSFGVQICMCSEASIARKTPVKTRLSRGHVVRIIVRYCLQTIVDRTKPTYLLQKAMAQAQRDSQVHSALINRLRWRWGYADDRTKFQFPSAVLWSVVSFCVCTPQALASYWYTCHLCRVPQYMYKSATSADRSRAKIKVCP